MSFPTGRQSDATTSNSNYNVQEDHDQARQQCPVIKCNEFLSELEEHDFLKIQRNT